MAFLYFALNMSIMAKRKKELVELVLFFLEKSMVKMKRF